MEIEKNKRLAVLILASGTGERFSSKVPKQYCKINEKIILSMTIEIFIKLSFVNEIVIVVNKKHSKFLTPVKKKFPLLKFINGGDSRQLSSLKGLNFLKKQNFKYVLIHDAVRPFVNRNLVKRLYLSLLKKKAVVPVVKIKDSVKLVKKKFILKDLDRNEIQCAQTPQGFVISELIQAYEKIKTSNLNKYTDDAQIFRNFKHKVYTVRGDDDNFKITTKKDLEFIKIKNGEGKIIKTGQGIDVHKFGKGNHITIFGKKIRYNKGLVGHSDADVGIHALIDAICGAINLGDIGKLFPDTDKKYKNIDSKILLKEVQKLVKKSNAKIIHTDNTVVCENPKISGHSLQMRKIISKILNLETANISIKATTTEKLGFLGKGEGIAAISIVTVEQKNIK